MANTLRIKRRTSGTDNGGVPTTLQCVNAELAFNEVNGKLYYGKGGNETQSSSVVAIGGENFSLIDGVTAGTAANSKALTLNSSGQVSGFTVAGALDISSAAGSVTGGLSVDVYDGATLSLYHGTAGGGGAVRFTHGVESGGANGDTWLISNDDNYSGDSRTYDIRWPNQTGRLATLADISSAIANVVGLSSSLKAPVAAATTANITLSGTQTVDGVQLAAGDRVLVKDQTTATNNGIYVVAAGSWARATDVDTGAELLGASTFVLQGTTNGSKTFVNTNTGTITLGTTSITFADQSAVATAVTAGNGLTKTGSTLDVVSTGNGSLTVSADSINLTSGIVTAGTYQAVTVDTYGRVTAGSNPTTLSGYGITDALSTSTTSTQSGYFGDIYLYDDSTPSHYLQITNSANLSAARTFSINVNDGSRTLSLSGNLTVSADATVSGTNTGDQTISLSGDASGSGTSSITVTLANSGVTAGTYRSVTVDAKGRVTGGTTPTTFSGYGISDSSQNLAAALSDETGFTTGAKAVFSTSPSFETSVVTSSTSFDVFNTTATTVNAFGAATTLTIGAASGTTATIRGGTLVGNTTTQAVFNATATTVNAFGAATAITMGDASAATTTIRGGTLVGNTTTQAVFNSTATTVNAFGAATAITMGDASAATTTIRGGTLVGNTALQNVFNTTATTVNAFGAATGINIGASGVGNSTTINHSLTVAGNLTVNGTTTTLNTNTLTVDDKNIELGSVAASVALTGTISGTSATTTITGLSSTTGLIPGMALTKLAGGGAFGSTPLITSVDSGTQITITSGSANTAGGITFTAGGATDDTADTGGITLKGTTDKTLTWVKSTAAWTSSEDFNLVSGKVYEINGTTVLSATALGTNVTSSSLTSVGTIGTGTWQGTAVGATYGGTGQTAWATGDLLYASGSNTLAKLTKPASVTSILQMTSAGVPSWVAPCTAIENCTLDGGTF